MLFMSGDSQMRITEPHVCDRQAENRVGRLRGEIWQNSDLSSRLLRIRIFPTEGKNLIAQLPGGQQTWMRTFEFRGRRGLQERACPSLTGKA